MVRYNLKYTGKRTEKGDGSTREFMLTKKDPDVLPKEEKQREISLYDVFRIVRNVLGLYISVYILGKIDSYTR